MTKITLTHHMTMKNEALGSPKLVQINVFAQRTSFFIVTKNPRIFYFLEHYNVFAQLDVDMKTEHPTRSILFTL